MSDPKDPQDSKPSGKDAFCDAEENRDDAAPRARRMSAGDSGTAEYMYQEKSWVPPILRLT